MINKDNALGLSSLVVNWLSAAVNAFLVLIGGLSINEWGVIAGIFFGAVTAIFNAWSKHRLVKVAEKSGKVTL